MADWKRALSWPGALGLFYVGGMVWIFALGARDFVVFLHDCRVLRHNLDATVSIFEPIPKESDTGSDGLGNGTGQSMSFHKPTTEEYECGYDSGIDPITKTYIKSLLSDRAAKAVAYRLDIAGLALAERPKEHKSVRIRVQTRLQMLGTAKPVERTFYLDSGRSASHCEVSKFLSFALLPGRYRLEVGLQAAPTQRLLAEQDERWVRKWIAATAALTQEFTVEAR